MGIIKPTAAGQAGKRQKREKARAEKKRRKEERRLQREWEAFYASPRGQSRKAREAGQTIFQIDVPLSKTKGQTVAMSGAFADSTTTTDYAGIIQSVEAEGWKLEHAGYVYRITGSTSRDKFMASGQQEAMDGEIIGIYIFRLSNS